MTFDHKLEFALASIDGEEAYRLRRIITDGTDEGEKLTGFLVETKCQITDKRHWRLPEDHNEFHTEFESAVIEILERLSNEVSIKA